jgi:sulfhydrogenase subunit alpha
MTRTLVVEHLARIEGHAGITVELDGREVKDVRFDVIEGMRLFEGLVVGREASEVPGIVSRICAICSHGHAITALQAIEQAFDVHVSAQTRLLRELVFHGSAIESHALHAFCLALPDFLGCASVIELAQRDPVTVSTALRLKKLGNTIQEIIGGRAVHPVNYVIGGFGKLPSVEELLRLRDDLAKGLDDCASLAGVLGNLTVPAYAEEPIRFVALEPYRDSYFFGECIKTDDGVRTQVADYRSFTKERAVPHSTARHSMSERPYMVGSLARLAVNAERVDGRARELWNALGPQLPARNVLMNDIAQVIELVYSIEHALDLVNGLLERGVTPERPAPYTPRSAVAAAASEVPRGTLFHEYRFDATGRVVAADVITPTAQNCSHVEAQFRATLRNAGDDEDNDLRHKLEIVARAYDPCVSCSVHVIRMR